MRLSNWVLPAYVGIFYLLPLNFRNLWIPDESRYAEISREMLASGDWVVPHLLGLRYFEKPVAGYWLNNIAQMIFGHTHFAVRFASVFATALSAGLIFWLALRIWRSSARAGAAALIYLSMLLVYGVGTLSVLDPMFTLWMTAAMVSFHVVLDQTTLCRRFVGYAVFGVFCGMGFLTKGFIALAVPVICIAPYMIRARRLVELVRFGPVAVIGAAVVSVPWALAIHLQEPDYWRYFFWVEHIHRFVGKNAQHEQPFWYFGPILVLGCLPWLGVVPPALAQAWRRRTARPELLYLLLWALMPLFFFSLSKGKLITYILPCFAPLALLAGPCLIDTVEQGRMMFLRVNGVINSLFGLVGVVALWWLARAGSHPVYGSGDTLAWILGVIAFAGWSLFGFIQWWRPGPAWSMAALCPALLALLLAWSLPQSVISSKQPEPFIADHMPALSQAKTVMANDVGLATSLAWALRRSDIKLYDATGELGYGLAYPDVHNKHIAKSAFDSWLRTAWQHGSIAVLLKFDSTKNSAAHYLEALPEGYRLIVHKDLILVIYPAHSR